MSENHSTSIMQNEVCFRLQDQPNSWDIDVYMNNGGYRVWQNVLNGKISAAEVVKEVQTSGLRGRGGAGFPTGLKWSFMSRDLPGQKYVVCNSDEGEPGTFKDRDILRYNPHQLIEGMAIAAFVVGADTGYNYVRGEFVEPINRFNEALKQAYERGLLGINIMNSNVSMNFYYHSGAGAYVCGEETALIESLEGKKGQPRFKPPYLASYGLYGKPTLVNNTETLCSLPVILEKGGQWFKDIGVENSGGSKIFSVSGHINKPGNYEVRMGTPFKDLLELAGGMRDGKKLKAVIPGGPSTPVIKGKDALNMTMDFDGISKAGSALGAGSVIIMNEDTDMVKVLENIAHFFYDESCGQCTPCREGTGWIYRVVKRLRQGQGTTQDINNLSDVASRIENNVICGLGDAAAVPAMSFVKHFRKEFKQLVTD